MKKIFLSLILVVCFLTACGGKTGKTVENTIKPTIDTSKSNGNDTPLTIDATIFEVKSTNEVVATVINDDEDVKKGEKIIIKFETLDDCYPNDLKKYTQKQLKDNNPLKIGQKIGFSFFNSQKFTYNEKEKMKEFVTETITIDHINTLSKNIYDKFINGEIKKEEIYKYYVNIEDIKDENYSTLTGKISSADLQKGTVTVDEIEWITLEDEKRMKELKLTKEDMPSGFYIYDENKDVKTYKISDETKLYMLDSSNGHLEDDISNLSERTGEEYIFSFEVKDNEVGLIYQVYVP